MNKLVRITTIPLSLQTLLKGQMKFMQENGFEVYMVSSDGDGINELVQQEKSSHFKIPFTRRISPLVDLYCLVKLTILLIQLKPQIVHTHTPKAGIIGMWAAWMAGVPVRLHTVAGLPWMEATGWKRKLLCWVEKCTMRAATKVYANSALLAQFLEHQQLGNAKVKILGHGSSNGINLNHFSLNEEVLHQAKILRTKTVLLDSGWVWLFVGRLVGDKGIRELVEAFIALHQKYPNDQLWLVGPFEDDLDPLPVQTMRMIEQHTAIFCFGFQQDVRPYYAAASALAFPSYREGFPNVPMQAAAMKCPLLLSDINGCNELVTHMQHGLLFSPKKHRSTIRANVFCPAKS